MFKDPRGPLQTITAIEDYRTTRLPNHSGGCIPVVLDCGHTLELNFTFSYRVGEQVRCSTCAKEAK